MGVGVDVLDEAKPPTSRSREYSPPCLEHVKNRGIHHDCGMFALPKYSDNHAGFARFRVVRHEIFPGRLSHLKTIKEGDEVAISFILGTHEAATTGNGKIIPRSHLLPFTCITTESGRPNPRMLTDECVYTHSYHELLPHLTCLSAGNPRTPL